MKLVIVRRKLGGGRVVTVNSVVVEEGLRMCSVGDIFVAVTAAS
jgi:hypothetical protein